jgi:hypothetical protein|tara:strand:+ start:506 stop:694 length:189 start_codon:yes stop_codon:yes gene_type:complete
MSRLNLLGLPTPLPRLSTQEQMLRKPLRLFVMLKHPLRRLAAQLYYLDFQRSLPFFNIPSKS